MIRKILFFILILSSCHLHAQVVIHGRVFDEKSGQPLAFVTVAERGTQTGTYSDIDGYFTLKIAGENALVSFSYVGYFPLAMQWDKTASWKVSMKRQSQAMKEVVISAGVNPAEIIMRKVIRRRDANNPEKAVGFIYDSYNKFVVLGENDSSKIVNTTPMTASDTTAMEMRAFFEEKHLFLMESATQRKHLPPSKDDEVILASRVSGLKMPGFSLLGTQLQSFSIYSEKISIMDLSYLSPLSNSAISKYFFTLEDTTYFQEDTIYTISFHPRKEKNFVGLKGTLSINTDGWAVQNLIAEPADSMESLQIKIQQQYGKYSNVWFPEQLNSFLFFPGLSMNGVLLKGVSRSYIRNVQINPDLRAREFDPVVLRMDPHAYEVPDSVWTRYRQHELDAKEQKTYAFIDSIGEAENFDKKVKLLGVIMTGQIPIGKLSIDLNRLLRVNSYEGLRLGAGIHTNDFLSRRFTVGGYYAYGFKDKQHKYGGDAFVYLYRLRNIWIQGLWESDVRETGGNILAERPKAFLNTSFYPYFISRMDRIDKQEVRLNGRVWGNLSTTISVSRQQIEANEEVSYAITRNENATVLVRDFDLREAAMTLRWAPGEKLAAVGQREVSLGSKWPVFYFRYSIGEIDNLNTKQYQRYDFLTEKTFRSALAGDLTIRFSGGFIPYDLPASLYYNMQGTNSVNYDEKDYFGIASPFTFETMRTNEFMHSRYGAMFLRHSFRDLLIQKKNFKPLLSIVHNMCWGDIENRNSLKATALQASDLFVESGITIDRLINSSLSGLGIGVFYRYGAYQYGELKDNLVFKLSSTIAL